MKLLLVTVNADEKGLSGSTGSPADTEGRGKKVNNAAADLAREKRIP
jgi:hypothetical protein